MSAGVKSVTLRLEAYGREARELVADAQSLADGRQHAEVEPLHLLYALMDGSDRARQAVLDSAADPDDLLVEGELCLRRLSKSQGHSGGPAYLSPRMLDTLSRAEGEAARAGGLPVSAAHLLLAVSQAAAGDARIILMACGLSAPVLRANLSPTERKDAQESDLQHPGDHRYAIDLTRQARQGRFGAKVGRDLEIRRIVQVLARRGVNNPLLVGEEGVGRHSIVEGLCQRIAQGDVPKLLADKRVLEVDVTALLSGVRGRGEAEQRWQRWLAGVRDSAGEVLVYLRDLETLAGDRSAPMAAHLLASALRQGEVRAIGLASPSLSKRLRQEHELGRYFVAIDVAPPDEVTTVAMLRAVVADLEAAHGLTIGDPALTAAASLSRRYLRDAQLPKSALDLVDAAAARLRVEMETVPSELDDCERGLSGLQLQLGSLEDDQDGASDQARRALLAEQTALTERRDALQKRWQQELDAVALVADLRTEIATLEREIATPETDDERAEALRKGTLSRLQGELAHAVTHLPNDGGMVKSAVTAAEVAAVVADWTGVPVARMLEGEADKLLRMEERIGQRVIGQRKAVSAISRAVRRGRAGLRDGKRPIGSFLFLGVSGVGKTELAKALAEFLFDDEAALTRLDMSEFMEKHTVARLLGAPPGYVDSEAGGFLTEAVRKRPYSVLLFDEVEKAHPDVFNILLQVLDDGRLTDSRGRLAHFGDCVIIMTSNLGAHHLLEHAQKQAEKARPGVHEGAEKDDGDDRKTQDDPALQALIDTALRGHFRPEFLNRIDDIVVFDVLSRADLEAILRLQLRGIERMLAPQSLTLELDDAVHKHLVELAYDPAFGARPLKRVLLRELQDPLAEALLRGSYPEGTKVSVRLDGDRLRFAADE